MTRRNPEGPGPDRSPRSEVVPFLVDTQVPHTDRVTETGPGNTDGRGGVKVRRTTGGVSVERALEVRVVGDLEAGRRRTDGRVVSVRQASPRTRRMNKWTEDDLWSLGRGATDTPDPCFVRIIYEELSYLIHQLIYSGSVLKEDFTRSSPKSQRPPL